MCVFHSFRELKLVAHIFFNSSSAVCKSFLVVIIPKELVINYFLFFSFNSRKFDIVAKIFCYHLWVVLIKLKDPVFLEFLSEMIIAVHKLILVQ